MKPLLCLIVVMVQLSAIGAQLHSVPVSNYVNVPTILGVATDGTNVVRVATSSFAIQSASDSTNAYFQAAIAAAISYGLGKTNPSAIIDSAFAGYAGLKLLQRSNEWLNVGFFDYTGAEAFQFRAGLTNGLFEFVDVQNDRTVYRYNGTNNATTFFSPIRLNYLGAPSTVLIAGADREATNSAVTAAELGSLAGVTSPIQNQITTATNPAPPVGSVIAWLKTLTNTVALNTNAWVECNGQTINDAASPFNGLIVPNLNASGGGIQKFLRGATASGGTGGSDVHAHTQDTVGSPDNLETVDNNLLASTVTVAANNHAHTFLTSQEGNLPSYYEVVWVMRIK